VKARLAGSLILGAFVAAVVTGFAARYRHAALMASAAKSGGHQSVVSILASGFVGTTLAVALVAFVLATVLGAPCRARQAAARRERQDALVGRRRRAGAGQ
jgi:hypothetical protein